jgi:pantoate--beta-alanine ligase
MCGRYVIEDYQELSERLVQVPLRYEFDLKPNWNASPTQTLPVVVEDDDAWVVRGMHWGLIPKWTKPGQRPKVMPINARSETAADKPMFKGLMRHRRCIVPANGFYEWQARGGSKQPYFIHPRDHDLFLFAVLFKTIADLLAALPASSGDTTGMRVILRPEQMQQTVLELKRSGRQVGLVPTMGALHAGHLSLVRMARGRADVVVASIFVNPTQFGPREDLAKYPRTLEADLQALSAEKCDLVFVPQAVDIYPPGFSTYVEPPAVARPLEGLCRPGHFRGVATVVLKLFNLIPADIACFGEKDYQQLAVIQHMARDLNLPIEIVPGPTEREPDGLALSSRNRYLSPAERQQALALSHALGRAEQLVASGERDGEVIQSAMRGVLAAAGIERVDYAAVADRETLAEKQTLDGPAIALIAAFVGTTRLIDNRLLTPDS